MSRFISPLKWQFAKARIATIVGCSLMVISVFLHWLAFYWAGPMGGGGGIGLGIEIEIIGPLALFLALLNSGALFLVRAKLRNAMHVVTGGIGAIGTIALIVSWILAENAMPLWGIFLYFIGCVISTIYGVRELKRPS